jgi:hypothetical protein
MSPPFNANRRSIRAPVVPNHVQGLITREPTNAQVPFLLWDVSAEGLGVWCVAELKKGETLRITIAAPVALTLKAIVSWVSQSGVQDGYRCGLEVIEGSERLAQIYDYFKTQMEKQASGS